MEIPYTVTARPDTGLWNAKIGIWLFLASEVMLFGGLFSSYIFLRLGADYHWPIHELNVTMGCFNTAVLIASSVTIVMAWAGVKMRKFAMYFWCLLATIVCSFIFLGVKFFEYKAKLEHYGVILKDGTILQGHLPGEGYKIKFNVDSITLSTKHDTSDPGYFMRYAVKPEAEHGGAHAEGHDAGPEHLEMSAVQFKTEKGETITLDKDWERLRQEAQAAKPKVESLKLTPVAPLALHAHPKKLVNYTPTSMAFIDSTQVAGKLVSDDMHLEVDLVDARATADADKSLAWSLLKDAAWKKQFDEHRAEELKKHEEHHPGTDPMKSDHFLREGLRWHIHGTTPEEHAAKHQEGVGILDGMPWVHHHYPAVTIPGKEIERWSNFTPSWNTYYAIYFCITGLHGAHVLAGALIMLYFLVFNSSWFKTDPEHLANRVETGGLFWHFVDLVWIFLFPLLYLL
jgi:heme/copper-type cytochrome/quinol oxidase subunit 3